MLGIIAIAIDAVVLVVLPQTFKDDDVGIGFAFFVAPVASIALIIVDAFLLKAMGPADLDHPKKQSLWQLPLQQLA